MKQRLLVITMIAILIFANYAYAIDNTGIQYTREGGSNLSNILTIINDDIILDGDYNSYSIPTSNVEIYKYNSTEELECTGDGTPVFFSEDTKKVYHDIDPYHVGRYAPDDETEFQKSLDDTEALTYAFQLKEGFSHYENLATVIYRDGLYKNGKKYDVKINIKEVNKTKDSRAVINTYIGHRKYTENNKWDRSTYNIPTYPIIGATRLNDNSERIDDPIDIEIKLEYYLLDSNGKECQISGIFGITDLDANQGVFLDNFIATADNCFAEVATNTIEYKQVDNGTYIYDTFGGDQTARDCTVYALIKNRKKFDTTFTFRERSFFSHILS